MDRFLIVLDPGHGVETPGKRSPVWEDGSQLLEHEFNFDIANRVRDEIRDVAFVTMTRETEDDVALSKRVSIANSYISSFDRVLYLSIHANAGGGSGWEVFTSKGEDDSDTYATIFYEEMLKEFPDVKYRTDKVDGDVDKESQFYVLRNTKMPSVLTENFFMDKLDPDCKILMSEEGREKIAQAHIEAIRRIVKLWEN